MIDAQKESRPTVQWLLDWHPYFWTERKRFEFLCAVGNRSTDGRQGVSVLQSASMSSRVLGEEAGSSGRGWRSFLDDPVWDDYTNNSKYRQRYNCKSIPHLLRLMRNAKEHPKAGSASAMFESAGGMERYFLQKLPQLLLSVWEAVSQAGWGQSMQSEFKAYLRSNTATPSAPETVPIRTSKVTALPPPPVPNRTIEHQRAMLTNQFDARPQQHDQTEAAANNQQSDVAANAPADALFPPSKVAANAQNCSSRRSFICSKTHKFWSGLCQRLEPTRTGGCGWYWHEAATRAEGFSRHRGYSARLYVYNREQLAIVNGNRKSGDLSMELELAFLASCVCSYTCIPVGYGVILLNIRIKEPCWLIHDTHPRYVYVWI